VNSIALYSVVLQRCKQRCSLGADEALNFLLIFIDTSCIQFHYYYGFVDVDKMRGGGERKVIALSLKEYVLVLLLAVVE
jgi:hypothetical protein